MHSLCYDVTGEIGKSIFILEDLLVNTKVEGILLNDYYMHKIIIHYGNNKKISFQINEIIINNSKKLTWMKNSLSYEKKIDNLKFRIFHDKIKLTIFQENKYLSITIFKLTNNLIGKYLDVFFDDLDNNSNRYDGLIGFIRNQNISFETPVQSKGISTLRINEKLIIAKEKRRARGNCWHIQLKDLIKPKKLKNFIY